MDLVCKISTQDDKFWLSNDKKFRSLEGTTPVILAFRDSINPLSD
jgi:hypothetical protein